MSAFDTIKDVVAENFLLLFFAIIIFILVLVVLRVVNARIKQKALLNQANYDLEKMKMELQAKKAAIQELKNSAIMMSDKERETLERIQRDNAILQRKMLHKMNEIDERTKRLELGTDTFKLTKTLRDIRGYEDRLFGHGVDGGKE